MLSVTMTKAEKLAGWIYYPIQLLVLPFVITLVNFLCGNPLSESWLNVVYFIINFLAVGVIFRRYLLENLRIAVENPFRCLRSAAVGIVAYWLLSYVVQIFIIVVRPDFFNVNDAYISDMVQENYTFLAFGTVLLVPVAEEALYRGLIFGQIYNRNRLAAYIISSVVFAAIHVISYIGLYEPIHLMLCLLQYLPAGLCLGWAYANSDTIWAPILMHITINQISILSMR
jgi:membrane protease YdiL (CAAX protease family)